MRRKLATLLLVLVVGTLAVVWQFQSDASPSVSLPGHSSVGRPESSNEIEREGTEEQSVATRAPGTATLSVTLIGKVDRDPLPGMRVRVAASGFGVRTQARLPPSAVTDSRGSLSFEVAPNLDLELSSWSEFGEPIHAHADISMLSPGELRELAVEVDCKQSLHFCGKVVAVESSRPIGGATVEVTQTQSTYLDNPDGPRTPGLRKVLFCSETSDPNGCFELRLRPEAALDVWVRAPGRSLALVQVGPGHESRAQAREVGLSRSATLRARIADAEGRPLSDATVRVWTETEALRGPQDEQPGLRPSAVNTDWQGAADSAGVCLLTDLPAAVTLKVELRVDARVVREDLPALRFEPGEDRTVEWRVGSGCTLTGIVIDQDGKAVVDRTIWLLRAEGESSSILRLDDDASVVLRVETDGEGRFSFEDLGAGSWMLGPAPARDWSFITPAEAIAPVAQRVEIREGAKSQQVTLIATRGLYIRGSVIDASSKPVAGIEVVASSGTQFGDSVSKSEEDGTFVLGPLTSGRYRVITIGMRAADAEPVEADAGQSGVVLQLKPACVLAGTVIDASTGRGGLAFISWEPVDEGQEGRGSATTKADGSFRCEGLAAGVYHVFAHGGLGRVAVLPNVTVRAGAEAEELTLSLSPGSRLRFKSNSKSGWWTITVRQKGVRVAESLARGALSPSAEVPSGHLVIEARGWPSDTVELRELDIGAGEEQELAFGGG